nr:hypothetical protein [Aeromonas veronii]
MSLFDEVRVQDLCARLLDSQNEKGCSLESRHGRELKELLQAVGGVESVGRSSRHILTEAGRTYLTGQLARAEFPEQDKGEQLQRLGGEFACAAQSGLLLCPLAWGQQASAISIPCSATACELGAHAG